MSHSSILLSIAVLCVSGCASYKSADQIVADAQLPPLTFSESKTAQTSFTAAAPVAKWWHELDDPYLGELVAAALVANHDLRIALAAIDESRAFLRRERLEYLPSMTAAASATREQGSREVLASSGVAGPSITERYAAGMNVSWELDVFGRIRHQVSLSQAQLIASEADLRAVQTSLAAEVASVYLSAQALKSQLQIAEHSVEIQAKNLRLVEGFHKVGRSSSLDLSRAQAQYQLTAARLPSLVQSYRKALNQLSVLTVIPVNDLERQTSFDGSLPSIPASVAIGDASALLKNRPDISRAEQALKGAVAEYNLRVADLYPQISLNGSFGYLSTQWSKLGNQQSETFSFTPTIRWAALDLTRVKSLISAADARTRARLAEFEKTVLLALTETDNALTGFAQEEQRRQRLYQAAQASAAAAGYARQTYEKGRGELRDVLDAEQVRLDAAQQLVQSEAAILQRLVELYKSLGGGWSLAEDKTLAANHLH